MIPIPFIWVLVRLIRTLWISLKDPEFQALSFLVVVTLASGAVFYRVVEGGACSTLSTSASSR